MAPIRQVSKCDPPQLSIHDHTVPLGLKIYLWVIAAYLITFAVLFIDFVWAYRRANRLKTAKEKID